MKEENNKNNIEDQEEEEVTETSPLKTEGQIIIEEKVNKPNGEVNITQYVRGAFLGKVRKKS